MSTKTDLELLEIYDALPSLLEIASERAKSTGENPYAIQDELRDEFDVQGRAFKCSMPYRSLFECFQCRLMSTQIEHTLFNPVMKEIDPALYVVGLSDEDIHQIREHGAPFSAQCRKFLEQLSDHPS